MVIPVDLSTNYILQLRRGFNLFFFLFIFRENRQTFHEIITSNVGSSVFALQNNNKNKALRVFIRDGCLKFYRPLELIENMLTLKSSVEKDILNFSPNAADFPCYTGVFIVNYQNKNHYD